MKQRQRAMTIRIGPKRTVLVKMRWTRALQTRFKAISRTAATITTIIMVMMTGVRVTGGITRTTILRTTGRPFHLLWLTTAAGITAAVTGTMTRGSAERRTFTIRGTHTIIHTIPIIRIRTDIPATTVEVAAVSSGRIAISEARGGEVSAPGPAVVVDRP